MAWLIKQVQGRSLRSGPAPQGGMVVAEIAVASGALVAVTLLLVAAIGAGLCHVRAQDAARAGARAAARGDTQAEVLAVARQSAPGAKISVARNESEVIVEVRDVVRIAPIFPPLQVSKSATAMAEAR